MTEKIFPTYTNATAVPYLGTPLARHIVLNYVDSNGIHHTLQGLPKHKFEHNFEKFKAFLREEGGSNGVNNQDSPFGRLEARRSPGSRRRFPERRLWSLRAMICGLFGIEC